MIATHYTTSDKDNIEEAGNTSDITTNTNDTIIIASHHCETRRNILQQIQAKEHTIKSELPESIATLYALYICDNLPEWNHSNISSQYEIAEKIARQKLLFLSQIKKINPDLPPDIQLHQLGEIVKKLVPDNHIDIKDSNGKSVVPRKAPHYPKNAFNLAYQSIAALKDLGISSIYQKNIQSDMPSWLIGTLEISKKKIGIVAIPSFGGDINTQTKQRQEFVETFFKEKNKWDMIIFDFRGNTGGDAEIIKEIGERISQKQLKYADTCEIIGINTQIQPNIRCNFQTSDHFNGHIYILQDNWNASATEGAIYMLSQIEHTQTIGENTSGTFAGGSCVEIPMPVGSLIIGTEYRTRSKSGKLIHEKEGMEADIKSASSKAFNQVLSIIKKEINSYNSAYFTSRTTENR